MKIPKNIRSMTAKDFEKEFGCSIEDVLSDPNAAAAAAASSSAAAATYASAGPLSPAPDLASSPIAPRLPACSVKKPSKRPPTRAPATTAKVRPPRKKPPRPALCTLTLPLPSATAVAGGGHARARRRCGHARRSQAAPRCRPAAGDRCENACGQRGVRLPGARASRRWCRCGISRRLHSGQYPPQSATSRATWQRAGEGRIAALNRRPAGAARDRITPRAPAPWLPPCRPTAAAAVCAST